MWMGLCPCLVCALETVEKTDVVSRSCYLYRFFPFLLLNQTQLDDSTPVVSGNQ